MFFLNLTSRGPFTTAVLSITVLSDVAVVFLFGFVKKLFFSLSLNLAPPLLPYVPNLIQKNNIDL